MCSTMLRNEASVYIEINLIIASSSWGVTFCQALCKLIYEY